MKKALILSGIVCWLYSCSGNDGQSGRSDTDADTTKNVTRNVGAAGTGGVGAGFGTGGSTSTDTSTFPGAGVDSGNLTDHR